MEVDSDSDFDEINDISSSDECNHGHYQHDESLDFELLKANENAEMNPEVFASNADNLFVDWDFKRFLQPESNATNQQPIVPPVDLYPSLPVGDDTASARNGNDMEMFQQRTFPSNADQADKPVSTSCEGISSVFSDSMQSMSAETSESYQKGKDNQLTTLQPALPVVMNESNIRLMGSSLATAPESVPTPETENALQMQPTLTGFLIKENLMETSATTSDLGSDNTEPGNTFQSPTPQLHAMKTNSLMDESDNMLMGCPDPEFLQNTDGLQYFVVPDDVANALKQMGATSESVIVDPEKDNALQMLSPNTDNLMETSSSATSDIGSSNTESSATETTNNVEIVVPTSMQCTSTPTKRRGKKPKLHESSDISDPRVKGARGQWEKRENKKKFDEEQKNKISTLQAELVQLKTELAKRETWKYEMEKVAEENIQLKTKLQAAVQRIEQLESEKSSQTANPVQTVKMLHCFQDTVSKLPNKCKIIISPRLAEMRAPLLTEESMQRIRQSEEKVAPASSGDPLQLTAFFSAPGEML